MNVIDNFNNKFHKHWTQVTTGGGKANIVRSVLKLSYESAESTEYTDAQIDDYTMRSRKEYLWKPPLRMTVRAKASHPAATEKNEEGTLKGTAGFGFWNKPFTMQGKWFTLPESVWFFYSSPPSNMALVPGVPGWGWKAQVVHTARVSIVLQALPLAITMLYGKISGNSRQAGKWIQRFSGTHEKLIAENFTEWHTYCLEWLPDEVIFYVDEKEMFRSPFSPTKPLGFVAWIDNEFAIATPKGELKFGRMDVGPQALELSSIKIEKITER